MRLSTSWLLLLLLTGSILLLPVQVQGQTQNREERRLDISLSDIIDVYVNHDNRF
ncbi:MAG: hypothetical protein WA071_14620 [Undibacterium umbellatum]|uniref:hypothetical protein n=1 Tax=Undibacterium umbellatum TaxID=2762300 RepID=UPI003BB7EFD3